MASPFDPSLAAALAPAIHEHYRAQAKLEGWATSHDVPYAELPPELKESNLAAARRIREVLEVAGLRIVASEGPPDLGTLGEEEALAVLEGRLEAAASAEHEGWMAEKTSSGWSYGPERDDATKRHPSLVPYGDLSESEKEKDRSAVRNYPSMVRGAGMGLRPAS